MYSETQLGAAHLVAAALGRALGVRVVIANVPTACTDGDTIFLPPLPVTASAQLVKLLWGFLHHEAGHCRHSDFGVLKDIASENDPLLLNLSRVFEDIRMERAHIALYPGAHRVLADLVEVLVELGFFKMPDPTDSPASLACGLILKSLRTSLIGQTALSEQAQRHRELVEQSLGRGSVTRLLAICQEIGEATCTDDALNLAYRVREFLVEEQNKANEPPPPPEDSSQESQSGDQGDSQQGSGANESGDADSSGQGDDASTDDGSQSPAEGQAQADASQSDSSSESSSSGSSEGQDDSNSGSSSGSSEAQSDSSDTRDGPSKSEGSSSDDDSAAASSPHASSGAGGSSDPQASDFLQSVLSGADLSEESQDLGDAVAQLINREVDQVDDEERMVLPQTAPSGQGQWDADAIHSAQQVSAKLSSQMKRHLESEGRVIGMPKNFGRRVSRRHLHRVAFKDYRIFERRSVQTTVNTSVVCLLDTSSSMSWGNTDSKPIETAREALLATMMALSSVRGVSACAGAFPARGVNERVLLLSDFGEVVPANSSRYRLHASGGTPMAEAILWACHKLATRPEDERKIIFVATDGDPNSPKLTADVIRSAERSGIEVYGLGIQTGDRHGLFRSFAEVHDLSQLCDAFLGIFRGALARKIA